MGVGPGSGGGHMAIWLGIGVAIGMAMGATMRRKGTIAATAKKSPQDEMKPASERQDHFSARAEWLTAEDKKRSPSWHY